MFKKTFNTASKNGTITGAADFSTTDNSLTFEGSMLALADSTRLFVPQGRMSPLSFDMNTGTSQGRMAGVIQPPLVPKAIAADLLALTKASMR